VLALVGLHKLFLGDGPMHKFNPFDDDIGHALEIELEKVVDKYVPELLCAKTRDEAIEAVLKLIIESAKAGWKFAWHAKKDRLQ